MHSSNYLILTRNLLFHVIVKESSSGLSTVVPIVVLGHEASNSSNRGVLPEADNLTIPFYTVVLQSLKGDSLTDPLDLLGFVVNLLLSLLSSSTKTKDKVQGGLLLDVVIGKGASVLKLLSSEDKTLLIRGDSLLVLDLGLDVLDSVRWLHIKRDGLTYTMSDHKGRFGTRYIITMDNKENRERFIYSRWLMDGDKVRSVYGGVFHCDG